MPKPKPNAANAKKPAETPTGKPAAAQTATATVVADPAPINEPTPPAADPQGGANTPAERLIKVRVVRQPLREGEVYAMRGDILHLPDHRVAALGHLVEPAM